jgi:hypothetical protein
LRIVRDNPLGGEDIVIEFFADTRYLIGVKGDVLGDAGDLILEVEGPLDPPPNDPCGNAYTINPASLPYRLWVNNAAGTDSHVISTRPQRSDSR